MHSFSSRISMVWANISSRELIEFTLKIFGFGMNLIYTTNMAIRVEHRSILVRLTYVISTACASYFLFSWSSMLKISPSTIDTDLNGYRLFVLSSTLFLSSSPIVHIVIHYDSVWFMSRLRVYTFFQTNIEYCELIPWSTDDEYSAWMSVPKWLCVFVW